MSSNEPINKKLYQQVKKEAKEKFKVWPSAYASGWLVKEYKRRGGTYKEGSTSNRPLERWYTEKWIDVCYLPKIVPCGRKKAKWTDYPYCRPLYRVNSETPKTAKELSRNEIKTRCSKKKKDPKTRIL
jgi:hypothetical protein